MTQLKHLVLPALLLLLFSACKKDKTEAPIVYPNYSQLKVGNYWIYERYGIDGNGVETASGIIDSCYIEKDTLINGYTYYKRIRPSFPLNTPENPYWRDSLHYIVNSSGEILFSSQNFTDTFALRFISTTADTAAKIVVKMDNKDLVVTVPAGTFTSSTLKQTFMLYPGHLGAGVNPRYLNIRFAENIGLISEVLPFFASNASYTERRLIRYKVQ